MQSGPVSHWVILQTLFHGRLRAPPAYLQDPLEPAASMNVAISEEAVREGLIGLHNGHAKGMQGLPLELLRCAEPKPDPDKPPPVRQLAPVLTQILNAAFQADIVPSQDGGLVTQFSRRALPSAWVITGGPLLSPNPSCASMPTS